MSDGNRSLGIAALAAALFIAFGLGAYWAGLPYPQERYQPYQSSSKVENGATATVSNVTAPVVERTPCNNPQSEGESDLCAQWRAAKAAEKSADWTIYGFWATLIGIALLSWQIILTREAVEDTGLATLAMQRQNEIAESAQRPWVSINCEVTRFERVGASVYIDYNVLFKNEGQMAATNFAFRYSGKFLDVNIAEDFPEKWFSENQDERWPSKHVLLPSEQQSSGGSTFQRIDYLGPNRGEIPETFCVIIIVAVQYRTGNGSAWHDTERSFAVSFDPSGRNEIIRGDLPDGNHTGQIAAIRFRSGKTT